MIDLPTISSIAVEDLITIVCETFVENLTELGHHDATNLHEWYMQDQNDAERRALSDKLFDIIEKDIQKLRATIES